MSLEVTIAVNGAPVGFVAIRRSPADADKVSAPDALFSYEVRRFDVADGNVKQIGDVTTVLHRYGDDHVKLAQAGLGAALDMV